MDVEAAILSSAYCCYCNWSNAKEMSGTNIRRGESRGPAGGAKIDYVHDISLLFLRRN